MSFSSVGVYTTQHGGKLHFRLKQHSGGFLNEATALEATVAGGDGNIALGELSFVGGGASNTASNYSATVGGGVLNTASGWYSTIPGGAYNVALGTLSFSAGYSASANYDGMFVWADSSSAYFPASGETNFTPAAKQFLARATGGTVFVSAINHTTGRSTAGVKLNSGAGSWSSLCDRNSKENLKPVDGREVLGQLTSLPVATWNYKSQDSSIRHIGPMAQDFYDAFGVGDEREFIATIDADGVALAAIQGLHKLVRDLEARNSSLEHRMASLERAVAQGHSDSRFVASTLPTGTFVAAFAFLFLLRALPRRNRV
jgi:hypothetical protein